MHLLHLLQVLCVWGGGVQCAGAEVGDNPCLRAILNPRNIGLTVMQEVLLYLICVGFKVCHN
jgi:hypothetical protein